MYSLGWSFMDNPRTRAMLVGPASGPNVENHGASHESIQGNLVVRLEELGINQMCTRNRGPQSFFCFFLVRGWVGATQNTREFVPSHSGRLSPFWFQRNHVFNCRVHVTINDLRSLCSSLSFPGWSCHPFDAMHRWLCPLEVVCKPSLSRNSNSLCLLV